MNRFQIFVIRAFLAAFFAVLLSRIFYPDSNPVFIAGLGIFLAGAAYLLEMWKNSKRNQ